MSKLILQKIYNYVSICDILSAKDDFIQSTPGLFEYRTLWNVLLPVLFVK